MNNPFLAFSRERSAPCSRGGFALAAGILICATMLWSPRMHAQICGNGFSADFSCGQGVSIDVVGAGAFGNASTTVAVPGDPSSVDSIFVEVMFKGEVTSTFADITIETDGGDTCVLSPTALTNVGSSEKGAAYRTVVGPASQVTANVSTSAPDNTNEVQSVTLFVVRSDQECSQGATGQSGILIFHACDTLEFGNIEAGAQPRDLQLTIPISELGSATLPAILEITLLDNGIVYDMYRDTLYGIPDNIGNFLTIYDTTFSNVPGTLDSVSIAFISPGIGAPIDESCEFGNGDSFIVGTVILSIACDVGACCEITCSNPPNDTLQCLTDLPPVPANLLDSIGAVNGMGQSLDSIAFVDTVGGTFSHGFCDFFITLADSDTVGSGCVADPYIVTRTYDILFDSSGVFLLDTFCTHTFVVFDTTAPMIICPADITVECNTSTAPAATGMATATDNCGGTPTITFSDAVSVGACPQESTIARTWTATDNCGNSTSCVQIITVDDSIPPSITCPADVTIACTDTPDPATTGMATATDNCSTPSITYSDAVTPGECPQESTIIRTWLATDACGNSTTCTQTISIEDTVPPAITCPADVTIECDASTDPVDTGIATSSDNCDSAPGITYSDAATPGSCAGESTLIRTWVATDACGNSTTCTQTITLVDTTPPGLTCPADVTIECDDDSSPANTGIATAIDNCDPAPMVTYSESVAPGSCPNERTITRTWVATDACGNSTSCVQTIEVVDTTPPSITAPADATVECIDDVTFAPPTVSDNCDSAPMVTFTDMSGDLVTGMLSGAQEVPPAATPATGTVTGGYDPLTQMFFVVAEFSGLTGTLTAAHVHGPAAAGMNAGVQIPLAISTTGPGSGRAEGSATLTAQQAQDLQNGLWYVNVHTTAFPGGEVRAQLSVSSCDDVVKRTYTATDACGNTSTANAFVFVSDITAPIITCPADVTIECDEDSSPAATGMATATDNCDPAPGITFSDAVTIGSCPQASTIQRTWTATDACGNSTSCVQLISIVDTTPPMISCPADVTVECDESTDPANTGMATATDNCDTAPFVTFSDAVTPGACPQEGTITRTWTATDACGNSTSCVQLITIDDTTPPVIVCPADVTVECTDSTDPMDTGMATATDNCDGAPFVTYTDDTAPGTCPQESTITRTWTATDACGNSTSCVQTITVDDSTPPMISCPPDATIECATDATPALTGMATATDNCDPAPFVTYADGAITGVCPITFTRTWTATDACGNSTSCIQLITLEDTTPPMISCPADVTVECDTGTDPASTGMATATDNCDGLPGLTYSDASTLGNCAQESIIIRTWTATDICGNTATCLQTITVVDTTPPSLTCPADVTVECDESTDPVDTGIATATDNCDSEPFVTYSDVTTPGTCPQENTILRTWTATDACGNSTSCLQTISVVDTTPPTITVPADATVECIGDVAFDSAAATDNCDPSPAITFADMIGDLVSGSLSGDQEVPPAATPATGTVIGGYDPGTQMFFVLAEFSGLTGTLTAAHVHGPAAAGMNAGVQIPLNIVSTGGGSGYAEASATLTAQQAQDLLDGLWYVNVHTTAFPGGEVRAQLSVSTCDQIVKRTFTATDACGNSATDNAFVTVSDITPPMITCPADATIECATDATPAITGMATAADNCDPAPFVTYTDGPISGVCPITFTRTWTATDACGNSTSCVQNITLDDTTPPMITCPADVTVECDDSTDPANTGVATATDNCDVSPMLTYSDVSTISGCPQASTILRTWTATDICGNTATCVQTINVVDTTPPTITCPADVTVECTASTDPADTGFATAADNCDSEPFVTYSDVTTPGACPQESTITRTWTATDACGNSTSCVQTITVDDSTPPTIICPMDITIECDASTDPADIGMASAIDNCDNSPFVTYSDAETPGACAQEGTITRTWTATDACGNSTSCVQTITLVDTTPPMVTCPGDAEVMCVDEAIPANTGMPIATDNCDPAPFITYNDGPMTGQCPISFVRSWTIIDACGNSVTCAQNILVNDITPPVIVCPADATIECSDVPDPGVTGVATATDNCDPNPSVTYSDGIVSGQCPASFVRTWTATDICGNTSTCTQTITLEDTTPPDITCPPDVTVECDASTDPADTGMATATDNCTDAPAITYSDVVAPGACANESTITRTWTATDICGNTSTCTQTITLEDTTPPTLVCPDISGVNCTDAGTPFASYNDFVNAGGSADDNCGVDTSSLMLVSQTADGDCPITYTFIYQISDNCGNTATCSATVTVNDSVDPVLDCPPDITVACDTDIPAPYADFDAFLAAGGSGSDDCALDSTSFALLSESTDEGTCPETITRVYVISDVCGNTGTCAQLIVVDDDVPPTALCQDITIDFGMSLDEVIIQPEDVDNGSFDNCGPVTLALTDSAFTCLDFNEVGTITIQLIVTDACGNTASCDVNVTGEGGGVEIDCPLDQCISLGPGECEGIAYYTVTASAICGDDPTLEQIDDSGLTSGDYFPIGITEQIWIAYNNTGDTAVCTFTIEIKEYISNETPVCNDDVNISLDQNCEAWIGADIILEGGPYGCYDDYIVEVEGIGSGQGGVIITSETVGGWYNVTVTDPETGIACWGTIHVEDKIPPQMTCIDVEISCVDDTDPVFIAPITGTASASSNPGSQIGPDGGTVTTEAIVLTAPANAQVTDVNITIDLDHTWSADLDVFLIGPDGTEVELATDVCGTVDDWENVTFDDEAAITVAAACSPVAPALSGDVQPEGFLGDFDGLPANGTWTLMITDDVGGDGGTLDGVTLTVEYFVALPYAPTATDACGSVTLTYDDNVSGDDCDGTVIERLWTATDESGNTSTCLQTITINPLSIQNVVYPPLYVGPCGSSDHPSVTGWPTVNGVEITNGNVCNIFAAWSDIVLDDCGGGTKIIRDWTILDWCSQDIATGTQVIKLMDNEPPVLDCPEDITVNADPWFCTADVNLPFPDAYDACGTPFTLSVSASAGVIVMFGEYYRVDDLPLGTHTITWTAEDDCGNVSTCTYTITVEDNTPPVPLCDEHTIVSLTNDDPLQEGLTKIPATTFDDGSYDNCSSVTFTARRMSSCIDFDWIGPAPQYGEYPNSDGIVTSLDRGQTHQAMVPFACCDVGAGPIMVELRVTDAEGNVNTCMVEVEVQDKISPFLEQPPDIIVSCDFWFDVAATNGFVDPSEDVTTPIFGDVLDAYEFEPSDRQPIILNDPGNDALPQPHQWGYDGWADDNCDVEITVRVRLFDDCSGEDLPGAPPSPYTTRLVERTWRARDGSNNSTTRVQRIWVVDFDPYYISDQTCVNADPNDGVIWPCDEEYSTCPDEIPVNYPTIFDDNCSLIGVTYEDTRFDFVDGACYKILREWTIIDWCQYDAESGAGLWSHVQVIKVLDSDPADFTDCPAGPVTLCVENENVYLPNNNQVFLGEGNPNSSSCSAHVNMSRTVYETCSDFVIYDVKLYPNAGSEFIQVVSKTEVDLDSNNNATLTFSSEFASLPSNHPIRRYGIPYNSPVCSNWPLPGGEKDYHRILWTVEDGCGNISTCEYLFRLEDCKKPSPVCVGLSSVVMPSSGEVTIWAADFNASSFDDCTPAADLLYSFSGTDYQPSMTFDCAAIEANGSPSFIVEIWVADGGNDQDCDGFRQPLGIEWSERNKDFCTTFIVIDDNENVCGGTGTAGGVIQTEELESVESVEVNLMDESGTMMQTFTTGDDGAYVFINPLLNYTIEPHRDDNHKNGVSSLDLVRIQKHLLGLEPFTSPYKLIAADANNSESVSAIDLVEIRKLILGIYTEFPNNESWRFVDADFDFQDESNPWPFDEVIELESGLTMNENFVGVKVGDVNGTVAANAQSIETRNATGVLELRTTEQEVVAGQQVTVAVTAANFDAMLGYQFTMRTRGLELNNITAGVLDVTEQNVGVHPGAITMSWHTAQAVTATDEDILFTLTFVALQPGQLSEMLAIGSRITPAEAYNAEQEAGDAVMDVGLTFVEGVATPDVPVDFALFQNEPNPFDRETVVGFTLPEAMNASLRFFDVTGKVVHEVESAFNAGYNEVRVKQDDLGATGMIYYRLDAGDFTATKKMIIVK